jgi:hypothetical protein
LSSNSIGKSQPAGAKRVSRQEAVRLLEGGKPATPLALELGIQRNRLAAFLENVALLGDFLEFHFQPLDFAARRLSWSKKFT